MNNTSDSLTSRRGFLKSSTTFALAGAVAGPMILNTKSSAASPGDTLKVGLIGCGGRGSGAALQALSADKGTILTAVGDVFEGQLKNSLNNLKANAGISERVQVSAENCFVGLDAYKKVINSGVDVVLLAAPPGFRPMHLKAAVEAGKHIFCEKPMATDAPGVRSVLESVEIAKQKKLALVAGFCWRYEPGRREFFKRLHDGAIGEVRAMYSTYLTGPVKPMPAASQRPAGMSDVEWQLKNWYNFTWLSGDGLVEQACHSIDKIAWAFNGALPVKAVGNGGRQIGNNEGNIFDHIDVFYEYADGARAFMAQRQISGCYSDNSDYIMGANGFGTIKGWNPPILKGKEPWIYRGAKKDMYQVEHDELFASIRKGEPLNDGAWMAHSTLMAIMGRTAAYTGQEITWEQALNMKETLVPENLDWNMKFPITPMCVPGRSKVI